MGFAGPGDVGGSQIAATTWLQLRGAWAAEKEGTRTLFRCYFVGVVFFNFHWQNPSFFVLPVLFAGTGKLVVVSNSVG